MDAGLLDVLLDAPDPGVPPVAERVHVELDGVVEEAVDQDGMLGRARDGLLHVGGEARVLEDDRHRAAAEHVRRAHDQRVADAAGRGEGLLLRPRLGVGRRGEAELPEQPAEAAAVLGEVDRLGRGAPDRVARGLERTGELERRLAAELHEDAVGLLVVEHRRDVLERERLEVQAVRRVVVGRDRLGVAVDHDRLEAGLGERVAGVDAAVVELDALADPVGPAAEDRDFGLVRPDRTRSRPRRSSRSTASAPRTRPRRCRSSCRPGSRRARGAGRGTRPPRGPCGERAPGRRVPAAWPPAVSRGRASPRLDAGEALLGLDHAPDAVQKPRDRSACASRRPRRSCPRGTRAAGGRAAPAWAPPASRGAPPAAARRARRRGRRGRSRATGSPCPAPRGRSGRSPWPRRPTSSGSSAGCRRAGTSRRSSAES